MRVSLCVCVRVYALRIVSIGKILRFINTLIIIIIITSMLVLRSEKNAFRPNRTVMVERAVKTIIDISVYSIFTVHLGLTVMVLPFIVLVLFYQ